MKHTIITLFFLFLGSQVVMAQVRRNTVEANQNQKALAANQAQLERDLAELDVFRTKLAQFEKAFSNKNISRVASLKASLLKDMQREVEQSQRKITQDQQEVAQSQSEVAGSNKELRRSRRDLRTPDGDMGDGRDLRDDRRDSKKDKKNLQDDKADLDKQIARTNRQKQIYAIIQAFSFSFDSSLREKMIANKALLDEFALTMEMDIAATRAEITEDKREALEDGRERIEDRREIRERRRRPRR